MLRFRHESLADDVLAGVGPAALRAVHGRVGLAIEQLVGQLNVRSSLWLAHHFNQAVDVERSLLYLPLAAHLLKDRYAPAEALGLLQRFFRHLQTVAPEERGRHLGRRIQALHAMAETLAQLGRKDEAAQSYREMAALAEPAERAGDLIAAWGGLAALRLAVVDYEEAESFARRAIELARRQDVPAAVAQNLYVVGRAALGRGRHDEALWSLSGSLQIRTAQGNRLGAGRCLLSLGDVFRARCEYRRALEIYRQASRQSRTIDDRLGLSVALNRLGQIHLDLGSVARSLAHHREALRLQRQLDHREGWGHTLDLLGTAFLFRGDLDRARSTLDEALSHKREVGDVRGSAESQVLIARVEIEAGQVREAIGILEQALTLARRAGNPTAEAGALIWLARGYLRLGERERACQFAEDGLSRARAAGSGRLECHASLAVGLTGQTARALEAAGEAIRLASELRLPRVAIQAHLCNGDRLREAGRDDEAVAGYQQAFEVAGQLLASGRGDGALLRRDDLQARLRDAAEFVALRGGETPLAATDGSQRAVEEPELVTG